MRIPIDVADDLIQRAQAQAKAEGRPLNALVDEALRDLLDARGSHSAGRVDPVVVEGTTPPSVFDDMHRIILDSYSESGPSKEE